MFDFLNAHPLICLYLAGCIACLMALLACVRWDSAEYEGSDF